MTAEELARRLITLIFAGRNRMDMIRRELPRTSGAGWVRRPYRIVLVRGFSFSWALDCHRRCCPGRHHCLAALASLRIVRFRMHGDGPHEAEQFAGQRRHDLILGSCRAPPTP